MEFGRVRFLPSFGITKFGFKKNGFRPDRTIDFVPSTWNAKNDDSLQKYSGKTTLVNLDGSCVCARVGDGNCSRDCFRARRP